jgi:hypothetical protein
VKKFEVRVSLQRDIRDKFELVCIKENIEKAGLPLRVFITIAKCRVHDPDVKEHMKSVIEVARVMRSGMT